MRRGLRNPRLFSVLRSNEIIIEPTNGGASAFNGPFLKFPESAASIHAHMKTKVLLGVAAIGIASAFTAPARAGVSFDIHIGFPLPSIVVEAPRPRVVVAPPPVCAPPVVVVRPPVAVCAPPPVVYCPPPPVYCPPPVVVYQPRFIPPGHGHRYEHVDYRYHGGPYGHR